MSKKEGSNKAPNLKKLLEGKFPLLPPRISNGPPLIKQYFFS
jgi:hypothetical protein